MRDARDSMCLVYAKLSSLIDKGVVLVCVTLLSRVHSSKTNTSLVTVCKAGLTTAWIDLVSWFGFHVTEFRETRSRGLYGALGPCLVVKGGSVGDHA